MPGESPASVYVPLPEVGQVLDGKYRIERLIGRGGMGAVFQARHEVLAQPVAIKFLLPEVSANPSAVARFLNEARAAAQIHNDHVARVLDVVQMPGGGAYMVLEYLDGMDLATLVANQGPLPVAEAVGYLLQSLEAIAQAHALGIVHRDLKPANLFLAHRPDGTVCVKVLDFGISKSGPGSTSLTATNAMLGSPSFMSPEQVRSPKSVDARSDLWSAGVCLYHFLTKELPYKGDTAGEVFAAILEQVPLPPRQVVASIPPKLEQVIMRCLQQHAEDRFADTGQLAGALAPFAGESDRGAVNRIRHTLSGSVRIPIPLTATAPNGANVTSNPVRLTNSPPPALPVYRRVSKQDIPKQEPFQSEKTAAPPPPPGPSLAPIRTVAPLPQPPAAPTTGPSLSDLLAQLPKNQPVATGFEGLELSLPALPVQANRASGTADDPLQARLEDEAPTSRTEARRREQSALGVAPTPHGAAPDFTPPPSPAFDNTPVPIPLAARPAPEPAPLPEPEVLLAGAATEPAYPAFKRPEPLDPAKKTGEVRSEVEEGDTEADTEQMDSPFAAAPGKAASKSFESGAAAAKASAAALGTEDEEDTVGGERDGKATEKLEATTLPADSPGIRLPFDDDEATDVKAPRRGAPAQRIMTVLGIVLLLAALGLGGYLVYNRVFSAGQAPQPSAPALSPQK
ncbi:MAG: serine/threonine-protein kinase [Myxococcales bacterium]